MLYPAAGTGRPEAALLQIPRMRWAFSIIGRVGADVAVPFGKVAAESAWSVAFRRPGSMASGGRKCPASQPFGGAWPVQPALTHSLYCVMVPGLYTQAGVPATHSSARSAPVAGSMMITGYSQPGW